MHTTFTQPLHFWRQLAALTGLLALLFAVLQPPPTAHLDFPVALLAWLLHVGTGMLCALGAAGLLVRWVSRLQRWPWLTLVVSGLLGAMLFAPLALGLEQLFPVAPTATADDWLDSWEAAGGLSAVVAEYLSLLPSYLLAWLLVNASPMRRVVRSQPRATPTFLEDQSGKLSEDLVVERATTAPPESAVEAVNTVAVEALVAGANADVQSLLDRLPAAVGRRVISISADLHYLTVITRRGRATLLGSLAEAESTLHQQGVRIHRSHWVAVDAVRRLHRSTRGWACELSDGRRLPVSRRRAAEVKRRLGTDFVVAE